LTARGGDGVSFSGETLQRELPEGHDHLRLDQLDLAAEVRTAGVELVGLGIAVLRRTALDDVGDVDVIARQLHRLDDVGEQLSGAADKRFALQVLVASGRLADEHQISVRIAGAPDDLRARSGKPTFLAGAGFDAERVQLEIVLCSDGRLGRRFAARGRAALHDVEMREPEISQKGELAAKIIH